MNGNLVRSYRTGRILSRVTAALLGAWCFLAGAQSHAQNESDQVADSTRVGVLTLINGNSLEGRLGKSDSAKSINWHATDFSEPFQFRPGQIKSIKFPIQETKKSGGEFAFEFTSGDVVTGQLVDWSDTAIGIQSNQFGRINVRPVAIRRLHRIEENATLVFASLAGLQDWKSTNLQTSGWDEDGEHLSTRQGGATLNGDLQVPDRAVVEFELAWEDKPNFVFAIGVDTESESDRNTDGWRFETVAGKLAVVREEADAADVDTVADLSDRKSIRLSAYVDQISGEMRVFLPDGTPAGTVALDPSDVKQEQPRSRGRGIRLINRGSDLKLQRLRIARWLGTLPTKAEDGQANIAIVDGSFISGTIRRLDRKAKTVVVGDKDAESTVKLKDVMAIKLSHGSTNAKISQCALFLQGGMRLSGNLDSIDDQNWIISGPHFENKVRVPRSRVRTMIVFDHDFEAPDEQPAGRLGRLELGPHQMTGRLVPATRPDADNPDARGATASCFRWQPVASLNASTLDANASGRIVYRDPPVVDNTTTAARALAMQRLRLQQQKRGLNFGELFLRRADNAKSKLTRRDAHVVHIRTGDVIACRVESIDEAGVHLSTVDSEDGFVPRAKVKAIELVANAPPPDLAAAKRDRLLTLPRLQKSSPPTHLLCSQNGDYLRCRLLAMDEDNVYVEVQLEEVQIARDRITQIIWFHDDELPSTSDATKEASGESADQELADESDSPFLGLAQVLRRDGKRLTFAPTEVTEKTVAGTSEVLGKCRFDLMEVDQLIFGNRIGKEVSDFAYNQWKLHPAIEPLVAQDSPDGPVIGSESPLIGADAPPIRLELLDGSDFVLSKCKGQIVVLDFWATWCAPCMLTMPLVEEAMAEFDPEKVRLVSVNLEEQADHVRGVLDRHGLNLTVALDIDGVTAQRYQARAIPQLVIVGADGRVERLYVGGGSRVVEQMKQAITELLEQP